MALRLPVPEILAPAGDEVSLQAAISAGADAVYFGLQDGFNARARAGNFTLDHVAEIFERLHRVGMQGFVTLNTLVFQPEFDTVARIVERLADAGADALIVQDLGVASLAQQLRPRLPIHASTQMTVSSADGARLAARHGVRRIVLPRELSLAEIRRVAEATELELECFVHGALCMSWSGQCLTSEALQGRSANRGQCAQTCRLPYELHVDGVARKNADVRYLLSPKDLAALSHIADLWNAGVSCFKIEGRLKGPEYVANTVEKYRRALEAAVNGQPYDPRADLAELRMTFSRGFGPGFLEGSKHQDLVHGRYPGHRGWLVGTVTHVDTEQGQVTVKPAPDAPSLCGGDRVLFDQNRPEEEEPRGTLFEARHDGHQLELGFGRDMTRGGTDLSAVRVGNQVYKTRDSKLSKRLQTLALRARQMPLQAVVKGKLGEPLVVTVVDRAGRTADAQSSMPLQAARGAGLDDAQLRDKLFALGETGFVLERLELFLAEPLYVPPGELKAMRRRLVQALEEQSLSGRPLHLAAASAPSAASISSSTTTKRSTPLLIPLLRTLEQVDATLAIADELQLEEVALDFMELVGLAAAVDKVKASKRRVTIATPRVQKPGEEAYDHRFTKLQPDAVLVRHLGAIEHFSLNQKFRPDQVIGDFSLNATNALTARMLLQYGLSVLTPAYDLDLAQLSAMLRELNPAQIEVTLHQHLPLYHTEHCVYSHLLSQGQDYKTCGRPCEAHQVALREDNGLVHPVLVDIGCRNTVFNARAQSAASCFAELRRLQVMRFRVELVREGAGETTKVLRSYAALLRGERTSHQVLQTVGALERYGVSSGTLAVVA